MWSKLLLRRFRQPGKNPLLPVLQGIAAFRLTLSRMPPRHSQTRRDTNFAIPGYSLSAMIPRRTVKIKFFLSVVIPVVKAAFVPLSAIGENPENAGAARLCGVSPCPVPDTATALPNLSGILFPLVYSGFWLFLICFTYSLTLLSPLFPGAPAPSVVIYVVKNASHSVLGEDSPVPDGKRFPFLLAAL